MATKDHSRPLTTKLIESLKPKRSPYRTPDYPHTGLNLSTLTTGSKKWQLSYTINGKRNYWTFATWPVVSLLEARQRVAQYRQMITDGVDPRGLALTHKKEEAEKAALGTVQELIEMYVDDLKQDGKASAQDTLSRCKRHVFPRIGNIPANEVTLDIAGNTLADIGQASKGIEAACRGVLITAWNLAIRQPADTRWKNHNKQFDINANPWLLIRKPAGTSNADDRFLSKDEVIHLWQTIDPAPGMNGQLGQIIKLLLLTGQRNKEVLEARWAEFDLEEGTWEIPWQRRKTRHKSKENHIVPLCDSHLELLKVIKKTSGSNEWLFPGQSNDAPVSANALAKNLVKYCQSDLWASDPFVAKHLRKTFKTLGAKHCKIPKDIRDRLQGHSMSDISSKHYDRHDYLEEKRQGMQQWCRWLEGVTGE